MKRKRKEVVVITGASAGLGRALAREFAKRKASIGLIARHEERLSATRQEIEAFGGQAVIFPMDVANPDQMHAAAEVFEKELGPIDIWINNAMVSIFSPVQEMTAEDYRRVTEVTYLGYVYGTLEALRLMRPRNRGIIIQVGSALAYRAIPLQSAYCAAKHAVQGFTESVRSELMHDKSRIKISMVQLPALNTPHFSWVKSRLKHKPRPVGPVFQPELIARTIVWAAYHYRREWYIGLMTAIAIVGDKVAPSLGDWYLSTRYQDQEYDGPADPNQPHNLYEPVGDHFEAHGAFDQEAVTRSFFIRFNQYRNWFLLPLVVIVILILFLFHFLSSS